MKSSQPPMREPPTSLARMAYILAITCALVAIIFLLKPGPAKPAKPAKPANTASPNASATPMTVTHSGRGLWAATSGRTYVPEPARPAEEIVSEKLSQFAYSRADIVAAMAKKFDVTVPDDVRRFFEAVQAGRWEETTNLFASLRQLRLSTNSPSGLEKLWPAILETYGVAEQTHLWPAQQLLDYGNAVLDSLRPGMVYVGGTDEGRFIPTLLADTSSGDPHIVLTQNALADGSYLDYVRFLYGDRLNALSSDDSQKAFQDYLADAQKRLKHDQEFPNEPKQIRPGEDVRQIDGRLQVSGQVAVMAINELLLQNLLQKNPDLSFALSESFPLKSFFGEATTLGPITELRATNPAEALTPERATQSLDYWRSTTQSVLAETDAASAPRDAYAKLILGQAGLFEDRKLTGEAEQAYQLALGLTPGKPEAVFRYVNLLAQQHRFGEAQQIVQTAIATAPDNRQFQELLTSLGRMK